jgi:hypothetical protein
MKKVVRYGNCTVDVGFRVEKIGITFQGKFNRDELKQAAKMARKKFKKGLYEFRYRILSVELDMKTVKSNERHYNVYFVHKNVSRKAPMDHWLRELYEKALNVRVVA